MNITIGEKEMAGEGVGALESSEGAKSGMVVNLNYKAAGIGINAFVDFFGFWRRVFFFNECYCASVGFIVGYGTRVEVIQYYRWREVMVLYMDNDFSNNIDVLENTFKIVGWNIVFKANLTSTIMSKC